MTATPKPEMTLPAPAVVPPIVFRGRIVDEDADGKPRRRIRQRSTRVPSLSVPIRLPRTVLPLATVLEIWTPIEVLPEITLAAPGAIPPTMLPEAGADRGFRRRCPREIRRIRRCR